MVPDHDIEKNVLKFVQGADAPFEFGLENSLKQIFLE